MKRTSLLALSLILLIALSAFAACDKSDVNASTEATTTMAAEITDSDVTEPEESSTASDEPSSIPEESSTVSDESDSDPEVTTPKAPDVTVELDSSSSDLDSSSSEPDSSSSDLNESGTEPVESTTEPDETSTEPVESTTEPDESSSEPVESSSEPVESTTEPETTETDHPTKPPVGTSVGNTFPAVVLDIVGSNEKINVQENNAEGRVVVLNFWFTACRPCLAELPYFYQVATDYADRIKVVAVHIEQPYVDVTDFIANASGHPEWNDGTMLIGWDTGMYCQQLFQIQACPTTIVINAEGVITDKFIGALDHDELVAVVEKALGK